MSQGNSRRRTVLKSIAGAGTVLLAGCSGGNGNGNGGNGNGGNGGGNGDGSGNGGGNGDDGGNGGDSGGGTTRVVVGLPGGGGPETATQAVQRVLNEQSDVAELSTTGTGGDPASVRLFDQGELDGYTTANNIIRDAAASEGAFDGEDLELPNQGFTFMRRDDIFLARDGSGIETTEDMRGAANWLLPPQWGSRQLLEEQIFGQNEELQQDMFENVVNIDTSDLAGALAEGRVDAFNAYGINGQIIPSWLQEVDARIDVHYVELTDPVREVYEQGPTQYYEGMEAYGWEQDLGTDTFEGHLNPLNYYFSPDVPQEVIYDILQVTYDHHDSMREGWPAFFNYPDTPDAYVTGMAEDLPPVHPGAEQFYKEIEVWDDSWPTQ